MSLMIINFRWPIDKVATRKKNVDGNDGIKRKGPDDCRRKVNNVLDDKGFDVQGGNSDSGGTAKTTIVCAEGLLPTDTNGGNEDNSAAVEQGENENDGGPVAGGCANTSTTIQ